MSALATTPLPRDSPIARTQDGKPCFLDTDAWDPYFAAQQTALQTAPLRVMPPLVFTGQTAAIALTSLPTAALAPGLYRVTYSAQITFPDGAGSTLTVRIGWTRGGVGQTFTGAAMVGDATTTNQSGSQLVRLQNIDQGTPITVLTLYGSTTPNRMTYDLDVTLEQMPS